MEPTFWLERWQRNETGFHLDHVNPWLRKQLPALELRPGQNVLVPLCGKSLDLRFLADAGFAVTGAELSPLAVAEFFRLQQLPTTTEPVADSSLVCHQAQMPTGNTLRIFSGDFFALTPEMTGPVHAVWDRAALVALPPPLRQDYAAHLGRLLTVGARVLLVSFDYPQEEMAGPPFCVSQAEIRALFGAQFDIAALGREDILEREPRFRARGLTRLTETCWLLQRRAG